MSRDDQVGYLSARLRLMRTAASTLGGGIWYRGLQFATPWSVKDRIPDAARGERTINPFTELVEMKLTPREAARLLPVVGADDFMLAFDVDPFAPERAGRLHRAAWAAGLIVDHALGQGAVRFELLAPAMAPERSRHIDDLRRRLVQAK